MTSDRGVGKEVSSRIAGRREDFASLRLLQACHYTQVSLKGAVRNATARSVVLYGFENWPVHDGDARYLLVFDHLCLQTIAYIQQDHRVSSEGMRRCVLCTDVLSLTEVVALRRLRCSGQLLRMPAYRPTFVCLICTCWPRPEQAIWWSDCVEAQRYEEVSFVFQPWLVLPGLLVEVQKIKNVFGWRR